MRYFDEYVSNTLGASSIQAHCDIGGAIKTSRMFYKIFCRGKFEYRLLFSNTTDSTFADGSKSSKNQTVDEWELYYAKIYRLASDREPGTDSCEYVGTLTFEGKESITVKPGGYFTSDPIECEFEKNEYFVFEIKYSGKRIPYFEETRMPCFTQKENGWVSDTKMTLPVMIGVKRHVKKKVGFLGDSITEGCGCPINSYLHFTAKIGEKFGTDYSFYNLGIGYGRADDAATDGSWLFRAKQLDVCTVCFGVNDLLQGFSAEETKKSISKIIDSLKESGVRTILFTVPPFNMKGNHLVSVNEVNRFIREEMAEKTEIFDICKILCPDEPTGNSAPYGGHPNPEGCEIVAREFFSQIKL